MGRAGGDSAGTADVTRDIRGYCDEDAATHDNSPSHYPDHHGDYSERMSAALPYGGGLTADEAVALVEASPWGQARIERLRDVEWAVTEGRGPLNSLLGTHPRWAVIAGR